MGNGKLFLPVKAEIRKKIEKDVGDVVHVVLYPDKEPLKIPAEMVLCLQEEPQAFAFFNFLSKSERKYYLEWIYSAKKEETKVDWLAKTINRLMLQQKMYDKARKESDIL